MAFPSFVGSRYPLQQSRAQATSVSASIANARGQLCLQGFPMSENGKGESGEGVEDGISKFHAYECSLLNKYSPQTMQVLCACVHACPEHSEGCSSVHVEMQSQLVQTQAN